MGKDWTANWGRLAWRIETRSVGRDGGSTLRIGSAEPGNEWLRFDCFENDPHWHIDPNGRNELHRLDELGDATHETFALIRRELPELIERAGGPKDLCASLSTSLATATGEAFLVDAERAMRHRPAILDEVDIRLLENRRSEKWHTYPRDVLPAWVAEMDFPVASPIQAELRRFAEHSDIGYPIGLRDTGLAEVFSMRMKERFGWSTDPARVEILSEVVQGMYLAVEAFSATGEGVIVQTPIYPPFLHAVRETRRRLIENPLVERGALLEMDFDDLEAGIDAETRVLLFCNPHNPSGRVFSLSELERLASIVLEHDLVVVSDEIHGDLLFDGRRHIPFASLGPEVAERTVTLTSPSKAFNIPGLRCAVAHFGSEKLQRRFNGTMPRHVRGGIGLFGIYASIAAWRWAQPWLDEVVPYLQSNRDFVAKTLGERIPEIRLSVPEATYLGWMDCSALELDGSPAAHFLAHGRVALSDGRFFGVAGGAAGTAGRADYRQHARLNFATSRPILTEVIDRMAKALGR
jgi:cysteine-S-conjugate beta-lyase